MLGPLEDALADAETLRARSASGLTSPIATPLRLLRLVNSLLDFSRIEAGRVEASYRPTDLAALTADLASSFRSATDKAGLRLVVDTPPLPAARLRRSRHVGEDRSQPACRNAFKFTFEGEIAVALQRTGLVTAELTVRDTGIGIPAARAAEKLFDRFHRVEGARGRSFEGSGIGLALVRNWSKLHDGDIAVESEEGRGTAFHVTIPLGVAHLPPERVKTASDETATRLAAAILCRGGASLAARRGRRRDLLDVEAAPDVPRRRCRRATGRTAAGCCLPTIMPTCATYISRLLANHGYEVESVADGEAALAAVARAAARSSGD